MATTLSEAVSAIPPRIRGLCQVAAELAQVEPVCVISACRRVLGGDPWEQGRPPRSTLNNDGSPLQLCISVSKNGRTIRLLGDPTAYIADQPGACRFGTARMAAGSLLRVVGETSLELPWRRTLSALPPAQSEEMTALRGPIWFGLGIGSPGVALYVNVRSARSASDWGRVLAFVNTTVAQGSAQRLTRQIAEHGTCASIGLEGAASAMRVKLYWRLAAQMPLAALGLPLFERAELSDFLQIVIGEHGIRLSGLMLSCGFDARDGRLRDVKIDVCAHCLPWTGAEWLGILERLTNSNGTMELEIGRAVRGGQAELAFVGLGLDEYGAARINAYVKAPQQ